MADQLILLPKEEILNTEIARPLRNLPFLYPEKTIQCIDYLIIH